MLRASLYLRIRNGGPNEFWEIDIRMEEGVYSSQSQRKCLLTMT